MRPRPSSASFEGDKRLYREDGQRLTLSCTDSAVATWLLLAKNGQGPIVKFERGFATTVAQALREMRAIAPGDPGDRRTLTSALAQKVALTRFVDSILISGADLDQHLVLNNDTIGYLCDDLDTIAVTSLADAKAGRLITQLRPQPRTMTFAPAHETLSLTQRLVAPRASS